MRLYFHKNFERQYQKLNKKQQEKVKQRLSLFIEDPYHPLLNNHPLTGKYLDYRSINIAGDLRAIHKFISDQEVIFVAVDSHSNLYS